MPPGDSRKTIEINPINLREQNAPSPQLYVLQLRQDDPRKCTTAKLVKFRLARPLYRVKQIPKKSLTLNPFASSCLLNQDGVQALNYGLVAIDCSWERVQAAFTGRLPGRNIRLPTLLASNPVNYAKPNKLSSIEALAASLHIMGFKDKAKQLLSIFKWGPHFLTLNAQPLDAYASVFDEAQMIKREAEYF